MLHARRLLPVNNALEATCKYKHWLLTATKYKQNFEIDIHVSNGGQGKYMKYFGFPWLALEAVLSIVNLKILLNKMK
jgi:hypothetical protein